MVRVRSQRNMCVGKAEGAISRNMCVGEGEDEISRRYVCVCEGEGEVF